MVYQLYSICDIQLQSTGVCTIASLSKSTIAGASANKTEKQNLKCMHKYARVCKGKLRSAQGF